MKKILYTVVSLVLLVFLLFFPRESLASAQEGMQLWLNILLPTLLPFMILTGVLIRTDMIGQRLTPMESIWQKIFGVSPAGAYAVLFGLLCGYPMGAKLTSDLYASRKISRREAQYLLTFTNHASPMFISSYLIHTCMNGQVSALEVFSLLLGSAFLTMLCMRLWFFRTGSRYTAGFSPIYTSKKETSSDSSPGAILDASIMNGFETITKLGGYILMFSILTACVQSFLEKSVHTFVCAVLPPGNDYRASQSLTLRSEPGNKISLCPGHCRTRRCLHHCTNTKPRDRRTLPASLSRIQACECTDRHTTILILRQDHLRDCHPQLPWQVRHGKNL